MRISSTIFIIDDDPAVLKGLRRLLSAEGYNVSTYSSALAFLNESYASKPACFIIDLAMPDMNGLELQRELSLGEEDPAIIFLTGKGDIPTSVQAMKQGAVDFLTKPVDAETLLIAVQAAIEKGRQNRQRVEDLKSLHERFITLTRREREVFQHVVRGQLNKEIAADLNVVEKTIKVHRARVIEKMRAQSLADLVRMSVVLDQNPIAS